MNLAFTMSQDRGQTDRLLACLAGALHARGVVCHGTVQFNTEGDCNGPCDMDVKLLPDGPLLRISQSLGRNARGCRLDSSALETAVGHVTARLGAETELLIINKFGKQEADGRGFRPLIGDALAQDIPVLVGVNTLNKPAFDAFADGYATALPPRLESLLSWSETVLPPAPARPVSP